MDTILESKVTKNRKRIIEILSLLKEIFQGPTDEKSDEESNEESDQQVDTIDMLRLESEESTAKETTQKGEGLKF